MLFQPSSPTQSIQIQQQNLKDNCKVSNLAMQGDPRLNPNYRGNPSLLIQYMPQTSGNPIDKSNQQQQQHVYNIVIDVGKTFREHSLRWFPQYQVQTLDSVVLTHEHADATFGIDDLRGYQQWEGNPYHDVKKTARAIPMPIYLSQHCYHDLQVRLPWCFPKDDTPIDTSKPQVKRYTSSLDVTIFEAFKPFAVAGGLEITPLPVMHGEDLVSFGFTWQLGDKRILYLSDISRMLPETLDYLQKHFAANEVDVLVLDSLYYDKACPVHYSMMEAMELVKQLKPKQTYLVGMNCDVFLPHEEMNAKLKREYGNVQFAHDGLAIDC
jgi:phosphoribosyl 1,2-cyclic phosphodiesterase